MEKKQKSKSFIESTIVLVLANAIVKVIGACFSIPLTNLIGGDGNGIFTVAYYIYTAMYVIATAGLPVAVSKMVAEANALGRAKQVRQVFRVALITFLGEEETAVLRGAAKFRDSLNACLKEAAYAEEKCIVLGPAPCPVPKINYHFRYRLTLRGSMTKNMRSLLAHLLRQFSKDNTNRSVSAFIDINGFE